MRRNNTAFSENAKPGYWFDFKIVVKGPRIVSERFFCFRLPFGHSRPMKTVKNESQIFMFSVPLFGEAHLGISTFSKAETRNAVRPAGHFAVCMRSLNCVAFSVPHRRSHDMLCMSISAPFGERRKSHLKTVNAHLHVSPSEKRNALTAAIRPSLCVKLKKSAQS